jgi:hypothetical protein
VIGTGLILWAGILSTSANGGSFAQAPLPQNISVLMILGVIIRSSSLFFPHPYSRDAAIRDKYEAVYKLISTASALVLLSHLELEISGQLVSYILILFIAVAGFISVYGWLRNPRDIINQSNWILGLISLSISASLLGNPLGSTAWGSAGLFAGGLLFLYSHRNRVLTIILLIAVYILSSLPFSLTASGWASSISNGLMTLILLLPLQSLLTAGYFRSIAREEKESLEKQPRWVNAFYPMGLVLLALSGLVLGITGWAGAGQVGAWIPALIAMVLTAILSIILIRIPIPAPLDSRLVKKPVAWAGNFISMWWGVYHALRRLLGILTATFEGDGGILWTILFLIVFISILGVYAF